MDWSQKDWSLFASSHSRKFTRPGISYILKKYCDLSRKECPTIPLKVTPHVLRHSRAMHMLQAGINLIYIRDHLGHESVTTTEIYARADTEARRAAIEKVSISITPGLPDWEKDKPLMEILMDLCRSQ